MSECDRCREADRYAPRSDISLRAIEIRDGLREDGAPTRLMSIVDELCDLVVESERESLRAWIELEREDEDGS